MACRRCERFPVPTSGFEEVGVSEGRHGTLYKCKSCGAFIELIAEERAPRFTPQEELAQHYPDAFPSSNQPPGTGGIGVRVP